MKEAIALIGKNNSRCVIVVNARDTVVGVFSEGDVLRAILGGTDVHTPLRSLIKPSFRYLQRRDLAAARTMLLSGITLIPILDKNFHLRGVLTLPDLFASGRRTTAGIGRRVLL
jgi:CBS domain-containing protein